MPPQDKVKVSEQPEAGFDYVAWRASQHFDGKDHGDCQQCHDIRMMQKLQKACFTLPDGRTLDARAIAGELEKEKQLRELVSISNAEYLKRAESAERSLALADDYIQAMSTINALTETEDLECSSPDMDERFQKSRDLWTKYLADLASRPPSTVSKGGGE